MFSAAEADFLRHEELELGRPINLDEVLLDTHRKSDGTVSCKKVEAVYSRVEAETTARSSSSRTEADIWREATGGLNHGRWYGFGSQDQVNALGLTLTGTSSPSVQSTAQHTQPQSSQTMMKEIMRVVQTMIEHYIPPDICTAAGPFQLPTFSHEGSVPPAPQTCSQDGTGSILPTRPAPQTDPSSRSHISDVDNDGKDN
ncbi:hypothetical protein Dimus_021030 [Dionaea muscipula]